MTACALPVRLEAPAATEIADVADLVRRECDNLAALAKECRVTVSRQRIGNCTVETQPDELAAVIHDYLEDAIRSSEWEEYVQARIEGRLNSVHLDIVTFGPAARGRSARILQAFIPHKLGQPLTPAQELRRRLEALGCRLRTSTDLCRNTTFTLIVPRKQLPAGQIAFE
jgi:hypothetical protein